MADHAATMVLTAAVTSGSPGISAKYEELLRLRFPGGVSRPGLAQPSAEDAQYAGEGGDGVRRKGSAQPDGEFGDGGRSRPGLTQARPEDVGVTCEAGEALEVRVIR